MSVNSQAIMSVSFSCRKAGGKNATDKRGKESH
jgi:hypothetical protein